MTKYINPPDCEKEEWLAKNAIMPSIPIKTLTDVPDGHSLVCLVDNGPFTAAAVVDSERDFRDFNDPRDYRPKRWLVVPTEKLGSVTW